MVRFTWEKVGRLVVRPRARVVLWGDRTPVLFRAVGQGRDVGLTDEVSGPDRVKMRVGDRGPSPVGSAGCPSLIGGFGFSQPGSSSGECGRCF